MNKSAKIIAFRQRDFSKFTNVYNLNSMRQKLNNEILKEVCNAAALGAYNAAIASGMSATEARKEASEAVESDEGESKTRRLEILEASLAKKEKHFNDKLQDHFSDVKRANGQPLNDKRNGYRTLNRWEKQNDHLRNLQAGIEKTKNAIEREKSLISNVKHANQNTPKEVKALVKKGVLTQWRKHPNTFFVEGVDKARIVVDKKTGQVAHKYVTSIKDQEQYAKFRDTYNSLFNKIKKRKATTK